MLREDGRMEDKVTVTVTTKEGMAVVLAVVFRLGRQIEMSQLAPEMQNGNITQKVALLTRLVASPRNYFYVPVSISRIFRI